MKKTIMFIMLTGVAGFASCIQSNDSKVLQANQATPGYTESAVTKNDTTVYEAPSITAELPDAVEFFRQNNKFKDWDKNNSKVVVLQGIVETNGAISGVRILRPSNITELDDEALRLIQSAKYTPGKNEKGENVRSKFTIPVSFPAN